MPAIDGPSSELPDTDNPETNLEEEPEHLDELADAVPPSHAVVASAALPRNAANDTSPLGNAHAEAVQEIERQRGEVGQLSLGINGDVGESILTAGKFALGIQLGRKVKVHADAPQQFVVAAPPGTGKTSHAIALMAATVSMADDDLTKPFGCVFVVDQIMKAEDMYRQINALLPGKVAVWTSDHDVGCRHPVKVKSPAKRFHVDDVQHHAIVVVTQAFYKGPRGDKARFLLRGEHLVPRALTIFDEQAKEVEVYDIKLSTAAGVLEGCERIKDFAAIAKLKMEPLLRFMFNKANEQGPSIETPANDQHGWQVARELEWFNTDTAEQFVLSYSREIDNLEEVFGFAAQMANGCAFIHRRAGGENGTNFVGYVPSPKPTRSTVLLDATADIDGVTELCRWRRHVPVPKVRYDNLHIIHAVPYSQGNLSELLRSESERRSYAEHAKQLIKETMPEGARGLVACKKVLVDHHLLPEWPPGDARFSNPESFITKYEWDLEGRHLAVTYWGGHGIGANDWKDAEYVFLFGEHFLPRRIFIATVQGLQMAKSTEGILASLNTPNAKAPELDLIERGHLLRLLKQMAMRGSARSFDRHGICGRQVLVLTCELQRLIVHADDLFPGATLSKWGRSTEYFEGLTQPEMLLEILSDPWPANESIAGDQIAERLGAKTWRSISRNVMTDTVRQRVLGNLGWTYESRKGRGGGSWFEKKGKAVLNHIPLTELSQSLNAVKALKTAL
jgi:hypothetical protein